MPARRPAPKTPPRRKSTGAPRTPARKTRRAEARSGAPKAEKPAVPARADIRRAQARATRALEGPNPPGVLALDELLWLVASLRAFVRGRSAATPPSEAEIRAALDDAMDARLRMDVIERLAAAAREPSIGKREAARRTDIAWAWAEDPVRVAVAIIAEEAPTYLVRDDDEASYFPADPESAPAAAYDKWAKFLEKRDEPAAAARVRRTRRLMAK